MTAESLPGVPASWLVTNAMLMSEVGPDGVDAFTLARSAAYGVATTRTPAETVRDLVKALSFSVAEVAVARLRDTKELTADQCAELEEELATAIDRSREDFAHRRSVLETRAELVGARLDASELDELAVRDGALASAAADQLESEVAAIEEVRARFLLDELERASVGAGQELWKGHVRALIESNEYATASAALEEGPGTFVVPLPANLVDKPWLWTRTGLAEVARWYGQEPGGRIPSGFGEFQPSTTDPDGPRLVEALLALSTEASDAAADPGSDAAQAWFDGVIDLIGARRVAQVADGVLVTITDDHELPALSFVGRQARVLFTMGSGAPSKDAALTVRLSTQVAPEPDGEVPVVGVGAVLELLVDDPAMRSQTRQLRLRRFLRSVCRQLDASVVVRAAPPEPDRQRNWILWSLFLLGHRVTLTQADMARELTGGHPTFLEAVMVAESRRACEEGTEFDVRLTRESPAFDALVRAGLRTDLSLLAESVLCAVLMFEDARTATDVQAGISLMCDGVPFLDVPNHLEVSRAFEELAREGHVTLTSDGPTLTVKSVCQCGISRQLRRTDLPATAVDALLSRRVRLDDAQEVAQQVIREGADKQALHNMKGLVRQAMIRSGTLSETETLDEQWLLERTDFEIGAIAEVALSLLGEPTYVRLLLDLDKNLPAVHGSRHELLQTLISLLNNAVEEVQTAHPNEPYSGQVMLGVHVDADLAAVVIEVADNGAGFPAAVIDSVRGGTAPASNKHAGEGKGLMAAMACAHGMEGFLEVDNRTSRLGGGVVRIYLPALT